MSLREKVPPCRCGYGRYYPERCTCRDRQIALVRLWARKFGGYRSEDVGGKGGTA